MEHRRHARRREYRQVLGPLSSDEDRVAIEACLDALDGASSMEARSACERVCGCQKPAGDWLSLCELLQHRQLCGGCAASWQDTGID